LLSALGVNDGEGLLDDTEEFEWLLVIIELGAIDNETAVARALVTLITAVPWFVSWLGFAPALFLLLGPWISSEFGIST